MIKKEAIENFFAYRPGILVGGTWHAVSHRRWDKPMIKALGVLFGLLCASGVFADLCCDGH